MTATFRTSLVALALALVTSVSAAGASPVPDQLTLRLPDVGPSYELGSSRCGERSRTEDRW